MTLIRTSFNLLDSKSEIRSKILEALLPDVIKYFSDIFASLQNDISSLIIKYITDQPEYSSLLGGQLQYEFGIPDPESRLSEILDTIKSGAIVKNKPISIKGDELIGGIKIQMIKKDFGDLLSLGASSFTTEKGDKLNWLQWLLLEGDSVIISDHIFIFGPNSTSRTGLGIMKEISGGFWRVPPEYSGTITNNWITRAIDNASVEIEAIIQKYFKD
jgi:hypothetical protein